MRVRLLAIIREHLGINERCIEKEIGLKRAAVRHHLRMLLQQRLLTQRPLGHENHYFPAGTESLIIDRFSIANHGRSHFVLREVFLDPGIKQSELAHRVGMTRTVLRRYIDLLEEHELIQEERGLRTHRYFAGPSADSDLRRQVLEMCGGEVLQRRPDDRTPAPRAGPL